MQLWSMAARSGATELPWLKLSNGLLWTEDAEHLGCRCLYSLRSWQVSKFDGFG
jgi:hypothetical protein